MMSIPVVQTLAGHTSDVTCCEFFGRGLLYTGSSDKTVRVWRWRQGEGFQEEEKSPLRGHKYGVTSINVSRKGDYLVSSSVDGSTILWNTKTLAKIYVFIQEGGESVRACCISPDESVLVTAGDSGAICVWKLETYNLVSKLYYHEDTVHSLCFSPDSQLLLTACTLGNIRLTFCAWPESIEVGESSKDAEPLFAIDGAHDMGVLSADFSSRIVSGKDSKSFIYTAASCGTDHMIKLWRIVATTPEKNKFPVLEPSISVELLVSVSAHGSSVTCIRFSTGGAMLASASMDKTVKVWNAQMMNRSTLAEHSRYVNCIAFNSDSTVLCSGSNDRNVLVWDMVGNLTLNTTLTKPVAVLNSFALNFNIPDEYLCPITHELMVEPVTCEDGFVYERHAIEAWFDAGHTRSPMTNNELSVTGLIPNDATKELIKTFIIDNAL